MNGFFLEREWLILFNPRLFIFYKHMVWALYGVSSVVKWVLETWKLALSDSIRQFANSCLWQPDSYPEKTFLSPSSFVGDTLSSGGFCYFVSSPLCSYILAAGFSQQILLYPLLPYKWLCFFSELWKERVGRSGCSTCFCVSNAFSVPLEKLSRSTLCYLGIKCGLMPSCECCIL